MDEVPRYCWTQHGPVCIRHSSSNLYFRNHEAQCLNGYQAVQWRDCCSCRYPYGIVVEFDDHPYFSFTRDNHWANRCFEVGRHHDWKAYPSRYRKSILRRPDSSEAHPTPTCRASQTCPGRAQSRHAWPFALLTRPSPWHEQSELDLDQRGGAQEARPSPLSSSIPQNHQDRMGCQSSQHHHGVWQQIYPLR